MAIKAYENLGYGLSNALPNLAPYPIVAKRAPGSADTGYPIGQEWVYPASNAVYFLSSIVNNAANWVNVGGGSGSFTSLAVSGNATIGGTLGVTGLSTLGALTVVGTANINASGSAVTTIGTGGTGAVNIGNATGNTAVTGSLTASTSLTATLGNITATNGNLVLSTAATYISLPGPVFIYSGAGAPSNGLALHVGDMYINTTAASATTRIYVATAASTWTNVTCAG